MATILDLLMALNRGDLPPLPPPAKPLPLGPMVNPGGFPMPMLEAEPTLPPTAPAGPPVDMAAIDAQLGPRPQAPAQRGRLEQIANMLQGFSAGVQGYGPQFLAQLNEPRRQFEAQTERFNARRAGAIEQAEDRRERQRIEKQRRADAQADREFDRWAMRAKITHEDARAVARQAFELEKIREAERIADEKVERQQQAINERQRRAIENELRTRDGAPPAIAKEISEYNTNMRPSLSAAAEKWRGLQAQKAQAQIVRLGRIGAGGGASPRALKVAEEIQSIKDKMIEAEARGDMQALKQLMTRSKSVIRLAARFPEIEAGFDASGKWPYVKLRGQALPGQQQAQPAAQNNDPLGVLQ